jgi:hypothetical protein
MNSEQSEHDKDINIKAINKTNRQLGVEVIQNSIIITTSSTNVNSSSIYKSI